MTNVDCISRTRTIERLKLNLPISEGADNSRDRQRYMQAMADIQAIKEMPSVTPQEPRWIPVTERLPEDYVTVMATVEGYVEPEARYSKRDGWEWAYESGTGYWEELDGVIAWMPLPEPYKKSEDEE